jgi:hypothetical protein
MNMRQHLVDQAQCTAVAADMLGGPVRALVMDRSMQSILWRRMKFEARRGIDSQQAVMRFYSGRTGKWLAVGAELYRIDAAPRPIRLVRIMGPHHSECDADCYEFWAVHECDYARLYGLLRRAVRRRQRHDPPLLASDDERRLLANTIGFLMQTQHTLREYGIPAKRGVLLLGEPGNGKTMACRWLRAQCNRRGLAWRNVTIEMFEAHRREGEAADLFGLDRPGIIFFDDVDMAIRQRQPGTEGADTATFLGGLDGLEVHHGVVYIFTTNATVAQLDSAFLRPGRIDLVLEFRRPNADLRRRFIEEQWHSDIVEAIDLDEVVNETDGLSFAELDEVKRLLVLGYFETHSWDWDLAWKEFETGRGNAQRSPIGFQTAVESAR